VQAECIAPRAVAVEQLLPFHHVAFAAVFLDQPVNVIHASAAAFGAFDTEHVKLALDVTEYEIVAGHCAKTPSHAIAEPVKYRQ
jgi:hypothetical protein